MVFETKRLLHREMKPDDFQALFRVLGDPETMRHYPYTFDRHHVRDWIERNMNRYQKDGFGLRALCQKHPGEMIGDCGLTLQNINGMHLNRDYPDESNGTTHVSIISKEDCPIEIGAEVINQQKEGLQDGI